MSTGKHVIASSGLFYLDCGSQLVSLAQEITFGVGGIVVDIVGIGVALLQLRR